MLDPALVVRAYREGLFPMAIEGGEIGWFSPERRGILPLDDFHVPARLARTLRHRPFEIEVDRDFEAVIRACAERPREGTWISDVIIDGYVALHRLGIAHSVEAWRDGRLAGGLYGVSLGVLSLASRCFIAKPTRPKPHWWRWSIGCGGGLQLARYAVGDRTPQPVRRDRDSENRVFAAIEVGVTEGLHVHLTTAACNLFLMHRIRFAQRKRRDDGVELIAGARDHLVRASILP
jgi:leucyl/phenylalanyl-tRNA--protein transferase